MSAKVIRFLTQRYGQRFQTLLTNAGFDPSWPEDMKLGWLADEQPIIIATLEWRA